MATQLSYWKRISYNTQVELRNVRISKREMLERKQELIDSRPSETTLITFWYTNERNDSGGLRTEETIWGEDN